MVENGRDNNSTIFMIIIISSISQSHSNPDSLLVMMATALSPSTKLDPNIYSIVMTRKRQ